MTRRRDSQFEISAVIPVHDVAEYLPDFLASLGGSASVAPVEFIFVDDGSTDASAALIANWIEAAAPHAQLIRTENRGVSSARNTGLDAASSDWVCFLDPDDVLGAGYFGLLRTFIADHAEMDLVATNLQRVQDPDLRFRDTHPLRFRFAGGTRVADLSGDVFIMNAASVAFPLHALRASGARFRTGLHASEDALFAAEYLLSLGRAPRAGFIAEAHYGYRKRAARTSAVDQYRSDATTYTLRFSAGYEPLLRGAAERGAVPDWLQSMVLYEMQWLLPAQLSPTKYAEALSDEQRSATLEALRGCLSYVDDDRLLRYDATALSLESRLLILALTDRPIWDWVGAYASMPRGWRKTADVTAYSAVRDTVSSTTSWEQRRTEELVRWEPDYFGQRVLSAVRMRVADEVSVVSLDRRSLTVIRPQAGETLAQTQDRHRRAVAQDDTLAIPAQEQEVYVRRLRPWGGGASAQAAIRREMRRRGLWSKDAMIGRLFRPGRAWLIEHDPDDPADLASELHTALKPLLPVRIANARGSSAVPSALRFGSVAHRIARARARVIVSTRPVERPSPRSRVRGTRILVLRGALSAGDLLMIRRFGPDRVAMADAAQISRLATIGLGQSEAMVMDALDAQEIAHALIMHFGASHPRRPSTQESSSYAA